MKLFHLKALPKDFLERIPNSDGISNTMNYRIAHFDEIDAVPCPCGMSDRAFVTPKNPAASIHSTAACRG